MACPCIDDGFLSPAAVSHAMESVVAPELRNGDSALPAARRSGDMYSLACLAYYMLSGGRWAAQAGRQLATVLPRLDELGCAILGAQDLLCDWFVHRRPVSDTLAHPCLLQHAAAGANDIDLDPNAPLFQRRQRPAAALLPAGPQLPASQTTPAPRGDHDSTGPCSCCSIC